MILVLIIIVMLFTWLPSMLYPKSHKLLDTKKYYIIAIVLAFLVLVIYAGLEYSDDFSKTNDGKQSFFYFGIPLLFLLLYKGFDAIIINKYQRHIYFRTRGGSDEESNKSTWLEFSFQIILCLTPLISFGIGKIIIKHCF